MTLKIKIEQVTCINGITLMVFHTPAHSWQFSYFNHQGKPLRYLDIFYSPEKAEAAGREWVKAIAKGSSR
ncbi:MAG: hypothetical protein QNJ54_28215 [Prochloraceae cyanobacterium]|nr:hypothetical protein [Prochloraceae cyanobacterium]